MTNEEILKLIALKVKNERLIKRLSQKELAVKANLALGTLQRFEQTGEISFSKLIKLSRALDRVNIFETFFDFEDENLTLSYAQFKEKEKKKVKKRVFKSKKDDLELWQFFNKKFATFIENYIKGIYQPILIYQHSKLYTFKLIFDSSAIKIKNIIIY